MKSKAFRVVCKAFPEMPPFIVWGTSRTHAKYQAWKDGCDVDCNLKFGDFSVKRAPEYDRLGKSTYGCISEEFLKMVITAWILL